jgi:glutathione synthase/RimK-type ligase-like ATP-grasp enzyme
MLVDALNTQTRDHAMNKRCAFLTMEDLTGFYAYDALAFEPLGQLGWSVDEVPWTRPQVDWKQYAAVVIRSTWDYQKQPARFLETLEEIELSGTRLFNPLEICRWNMDKRYLRDLQRKGVSIIPTLWGESIKLSDLDRWTGELNSERLVIKPVVGANADDTFVLSCSQLDEFEERLPLFQARPFMVQPFVESIQSQGEYSLFYFGGQYSHAINKRPQAGDFRVQEEHGGQIRAVEADLAWKSAGQAVLDQLGEQLLYARVDLVYWSDEPTLMEVELIEPSLYFSYDADSAGRFARALDRMMQPMPLPSRSIPQRR